MNTTSPAPTTTPAFARTGSQIFTILVAAMAVVIVLSNIGATKGVTFGPIITDGGFFLFPLAYIIGDILAEVFGFKGARLATLISFGASAFASVTFWIVISLPAASWYDGQEALERTLGPVWQIVVASLLAFLAGQLLNAWILVRLKNRLGERHLVIRLLGSTVAGVAVDTLIFCSIAASVIGISGTGDFLNYLFVGIVYKVGVEIAVVPLTVATIRVIKRHEKTYSPTSISD